MDLADDVAYSVHDLEDGIVAGRIDLAWLTDAGARADVWATVRDWYLPDVRRRRARRRARGCCAAWAPGPARRTTAAGAALAALKDLTSDLIGLFCTQVRDATIDKHGDRPLVRYAADLVVPRRPSLAIAALKGVAAHYVMRAEDRVAVLGRQREVVTELVSLLAAAWPGGADAAAAGRLRGRRTPTPPGCGCWSTRSPRSPTPPPSTWHARLR